MITFRPMTLLVATPLRRPCTIAGALLALLAPGARAQTELSHLDDASPIPRGMLRLGVSNVWTRYDQRYSANGLASLGDELSADSLGVAQLPLLTPIQSSLQALADDPRVRLSLGRLTTRGDARIVTTPIALEYGLTRRLSVGIIVPVVQTRRTVSLAVNTDPTSAANVGYVPASQRAAAANANSAAAAQYQQAANDLAALISRCAATPSGSGCAAVNEDASGAAAARALALQFAAAARALGTTSATALVAPRATGSVASRIESQRTALNQQLLQYLGAGAAQVSQVYFAPTDFSYIDLQGRNGTGGLLQSALGGGLDSLHTSERLGLGDVSIGAQYLLFDHFQRDTLPLKGLQTRLAIGGAFRFATSRPDTAVNLVDIGTGDGAGVELRSAFDAIIGRLGGTVAAKYVKSFARTVSGPLLGDPDAGFPIPAFGAMQRTAGDVLDLALTPRYLITETLALDGAYGLQRVGATTYTGSTTADLPSFCTLVSCARPVLSARTAQRLGLGLRYSTVDSFLRGSAPFPVEVSFTHLTTISGDPGVAKLSRDQIQLRLYYQLFGR